MAIELPGNSGVFISTLAFEDAAGIIHNNYADTDWLDATFSDKVWARGTLRAALDRLFPELYDQEVAEAPQTS